MNNGSIVRRVALVSMLMFYGGLLVFLWLMENFVFFWSFIGIGLCIGIGEVVNALWVYKKTLSTEFLHTVEGGGKKRVYAYLALACLGIAIGSLIVHLGWV